MKTKIIYISGNEVFDMADIRAAFEEVRNTLHLGSDTVMFGVPVDNDDAFAGAVKTDDVAPVQVVETAPEINDDVAPVITSVAAADVVPEPETVPMKKSTKRGRAKNKVTQPVVDATPVDTDENADTQKIIPILSVLGGKSESALDNATEISLSLCQISCAREIESKLSFHSLALPLQSRQAEGGMACAAPGPCGKRQPVKPTTKNL